MPKSELPLSLKKIGQIARKTEEQIPNPVKIIFLLKICKYLLLNSKKNHKKNIWEKFVFSILC